MVGIGHLEWFKQLPCSVMICDKKYTILYMNEKAAQVTSKDGGKALIGKNLMDCHPPEARVKLKKIMALGRPNVYTTETRGAKKLVYQCRWKKGRRVGGLVEFSFELPGDITNFIRT
jgi:PAS domain-containing protein